MGTIVLEQRQYSTYILTNEAGFAQIEVVPERGGIITRWQVHDRELLYLDADRFVKPELSIRGEFRFCFQFAAIC